jgi:hypothetical protein
MPRRLLLTMFVILVACELSARADSSTTQPASTQPTTPSISDSAMQSWFEQLASDDGTKRDEARTLLMGLSRDALPRLRKLVEASVPLAPDQTASLHEIVLQSYLSGEPYPEDQLQRGFLGLSWSPSMNAEFIRLGVPVEKRLPGFPSFQMLRDGDLILGVLLKPKAPSYAWPNIQTRSLGLLQQAIADLGAKHEVVLEVLRQGQTIHVSLRLGARPLLMVTEVDAFSAARLQKAEGYWKQEFVPLLRPRIL